MDLRLLVEPDLEFECWLVESLDSGAVGAGDVLILWKDRLDIDWLDNVAMQQRASLLDMAKRGTNMMEAYLKHMAYGCT